MDGSNDTRLTQPLIDALCQEEVDALEEQGLEVSPEKLEKRLAARVAHLSAEDVAALKARLAARRASRMVSRSVRSAIRLMRGG